MESASTADLSRYVKCDLKKPRISLSLNREDIAQRFLYLVDRWLEDPKGNCPHPFSLLFEVFEHVRERLNAFKDQVQCYDFSNFKKAPFAGPHRRRIDNIFEYLDSFGPNHQSPNFEFKFATRDHRALCFAVSGTLFEKAQNDYSIGGRREISTRLGTLIIDNGPEKVVKTEDVLQYATQELKTQTNHYVTFRNFTLGDVCKTLRQELQKRLDRFAAHSSAETLVSAKYPRNGPVVAYVCMVTNRYYVCDCFREGESFWLKSLPEQAQKKGWSYKHAICHLCTKEVPDERQFLTYEYDSVFKSTYNPWINYRCYLAQKQGLVKFPGALVPQEVLDRVMTALQVEVDWGQWQNEKFLYLSLKNHFEGRFEVLYQARPKFLKRQSFDVFIPDIGVAVEYDGEQHYNPETYFAQLSDFEKLQARDRKKDLLAQKNGVRLFRVSRGYALEKLVKKIELYASKISQIQ